MAALPLGLAAPAWSAPGNRVAVLVLFEDPPRTADVAAIERAGGRVDHRYRIVPAVAAVVPEAALDGLRRNPRVAAVEPDAVVRGLDYRSTHDWGIAHIRADQVHAGGNTGGTDAAGNAVRLAVLDSGIDCDHVELSPPRCQLGPTYVDGTSDSDDDWGHGTHVAGSVGAELDAGTSTGVVGVAPSATLIAYKVLDDQGYGSISDVIAAVDHVWNGGNRKAEVVNMSLGWRTGSRSFKQTMDRAYASGIVLVAAAGNGGSCSSTRNTVSYPARYESVVAVGAVDQSNVRPCWSSTGDEVELAAPGVSVFSTWPADLSTSPRDPQPVCEASTCHYKYGSGTSMAVPHVAGAAALVLASGTVIDANGANGAADEIRGRLDATAVDLGPSGRDRQYGYGLVDAYRAASGG
ncbi:MAG: S8 family serine peptidase [Actinomycetota bacterium]|nr:S8 family serine peptidase [Actinomycetota bacterium]